MSTNFSPALAQECSPAISNTEKQLVFTTGIFRHRHATALQPHPHDPYAANVLLVASMLSVVLCIDAPLGPIQLQSLE